MADVLWADSAALTSWERELRAAAAQLADHAERFRERCGRCDGAYGNLPESRDVDARHLADVTAMSDHLDERITRLHAQADYLGTMARTYCGTQASALDAIHRQAPLEGG
jgi:hypothetical protein